MKKFLVILLSLAVLFGFAACDNSSSTPDTSEETAASTVTDGMIKEVINDVFATAGFDGGLSASITDLLGAKASDPTELIDRAKYDVTVSSDYTTITVSTEVNEASSNGTYPAQDVTLVVTGVDVTAPGTTGTYTIQLNTFDYSFNSYVDGDSVADVTAVTGTFGGYFAGSAYATIVVTDGEVSSCKVTIVDTALDIILDKDPAAMTLSFEGYDPASSERLFDLVERSNVTGISAYLYDTYENATGTGIADKTKTAVDAYVKALLTKGTTGAAVIEALSDKDSSSAPITYAYNKANGGSLVITYTPDADEEIVAFGSSDAQKLTLAKDTSLVVTLAGKSTTTAGDTNFTATTCTIDGVLKADDAAAFDTIDINITVDLTAGLGITDTTSTLPKYTDVDLSTADADIDGTAVVTVPYGANIVESETAPYWVLEDGQVTKTY